MTTTNATTMKSLGAAPAQRSWAQVVQPDAKDSSDTQKLIKPAPRGTLLRFCRGEVLSMLSNFGLLMVYGNIDHPAAEQHEGDIYVHKDDIVDNKSLYPGDIVNFYVYVDDKGLGAEMCCVEKRAANVDEIAAVFTRLSNVFASLDDDDEVEDFGLVVNNVAKRLSNVFASIEDDADKLEDSNNVAKRLSNIFASYDSDDEEVDHGRGPDATLVKPWGARSDGSTSEGTTSDSEEDVSLGAVSDSEDEHSACLASTGKLVPIRPPPGLSLTAEE